MHARERKLSQLAFAQNMIYIDKVISKIIVHTNTIAV
jgi:hypothetical protein